MDDESFQFALDSMATARHGAFHDGELDESKEIWEQPYFEIAWERLTRSCHRERLRLSAETAPTPEWKRIFTEAYRQSLLRRSTVRSKPPAQ